MAYKEEKKGKKVIIKGDLSTSVDYKGNYFVKPDMLKYAGKEATIVAVEEDCFRLDIDNERWSWTKSMLGKRSKKKFINELSVEEIIAELRRRVNVKAEA